MKTPATPPPVAVGISAPQPADGAAASGSQGNPASAAQPKRRTMITTPSGQWALGKTIGAGSMGKVKIAKNLETGEQVGGPNATPCQ
jgi:serine/threonine protein kinase KIN1/2